MIWNSVAWMTTIDVLIVSLAGCAILFFVRNHKKFNAAKAQWGGRAILLGIVSFGAIYLFDLAIMHIFPMFMPVTEAMSYMSYLHLHMSWFIAAISISTIVLGFFHVSRSLLSSRENAERTLTELHQRDLALMAQNERFQTALRNMSQGLCMFDGEQRLIVCNERWVTMYGLAPEQAKPGTTLHQILRSRVANDMHEGNPEEYIEKIHNSVVEMEDTKSIRHLNDGRIIEVIYRPMSGGGWVATHEDISECKKAEKALQESEAQLRAILDNVPVCLNMKDNKSRYLFANRPYQEWYGVTDELVGKTIEEFHLDPLRAKDVTKIEKKVLETGEPRESEIRIKRPSDGQMYDRLLIKFPVKSPDGSIIGLGTFALDITNRKRAEEELIHHRDHLQELVDTATVELKSNAVELSEALTKEKELNELQRQFVTMASHEFRTPLTIIDSSAQRLMRRAGKGHLTPEDAAKRIGKIRGAVRRMTRLMESTLTAASMQEGKVKIDIKPCDIGKVVSEVCVRQQEVAEHHVISCDMARLPKTIQADTGSLEQVLTNLLSNAVKYSPDAPEIEVKARKEGHQIVISVRDHGIGIDQEDLSHIGERFFRAKTSTGIAGTGIGLNLVKTFVKMHGGSLAIQSEKGQGSIFTICLPIAGPDLSEQAEAKVA